MKTGMTQTKMAEEIGSSQSAISRELKPIVVSEAATQAGRTRLYKKSSRD